MAKFGGFGGGGGMGGMNMQQMMKQAQKMQEQMAAAQAELEDVTVEGSAGGGLVKVILNGKKIMQSVTIKPEAVDPDDIEMLEDLITAAYNDAYARAEEIEKDKMPFGGIM